MTNPLYPLLLERYLSPRLWGGERLKDFLDLDQLPFEDPLGESWQIYAENRVLNGAYAGTTLQAVAEILGEALLGRASVERYGTKVPLLAKFIDAKDKLSIQVHPDDTYARSHEASSGHLGKTEAWFVLETEPGASIVWGFKETVSKHTVREAIQQGTLEQYLNVVPVQSGDVIFNPAGTVHAVGAGVLLYEIQQSSDLTYRLYDYQRRGSDGALRELHVEKALDVAHLVAGERAKLQPHVQKSGWQTLVDSEFFVLEQREVGAELELATESSSLEILTTYQGSITLRCGEQSMLLSRGTSVLLPALLGSYSLAGTGRVLRSYLPSG
ncbi:MAG: class I mannose-6-phosphate isomerase [Trueperaceae bacterium]|nr:MAG: class I mannose-6-phosphate isomerase [Trueperaceae bacterium]